MSLIHKEHSYTYMKRPATQLKIAETMLEEMQTATRQTEMVDYTGSHRRALWRAHFLLTLHRLQSPKRRDPHLKNASIRLGLGQASSLFS